MFARAVAAIGDAAAIARLKELSPALRRRIVAWLCPLENIVRKLLLAQAAELRRAECLERLGRSSDARLAYEQYLRRDNPISADKARRRLGSLEGGASDEGGVQ